MRGIRLTTVVMGCVLGLASGASAQVTPVVAGDSITAAGINAIIDAVNGVGAFQGNLELPATTPLTGQFQVNGARFLHSFGTHNTFLGRNAGNFTLTGSNNTAVGNTVLLFNTFGSNNTAVGNTVLLFNTFGSNNTAVGEDALVSNTEGGSNTAVGEDAGSLATTGDHNIYLGANVFGVAGEANTMYLGRVGTQTTTFIAGVRGSTTGVADAIQVLIDSSGQLGTVSSSRRYKEDIQDMGRASAGLLDLRPVTFRYTQASTDGATPIQYGLIAEEVAAIYPDVVVYNDAGQPETVQYRKVNAMLLNEVQRQHRQIEAQQEQLEALLTRLAAVERRLDTKGVPRLKPANAS